MKFKVNKKTFYQAIQNIIGVVPIKTTIPILGSILVDLQGNELNLTGTDLEVSISTRIEVQGESDGAVAVPAKILFEIVRELPEIPMEFVCDEDYKIVLNTEKGFYKLSGESKDDFPKISVEQSQGSFSIDSEKLDGMINKTIFAVSTDELRTTLMGVYLKIMPDELRMVATDGHRLVKIIDKNFSSDLEQEAIIPTKALNLLSKNLNGTKEIKINLSEDHIIFELDKTIIFSKGIDGQFPNYERVIPADNDKELTINREQLSSSVRRVAIFSNSITHQIRFSMTKGNVKIKSEDIEFGGEAEETIDADYNYDDLDVGYNANYLLDILRHLDTDEIILKVKDQISAGIIYPINQKENEDILMLLMPIRLNED
ncbi:DNA polymerase III subunit beta [candidate division KSB1 bacterium]|nr:DNA polymerase III subunit beta [candidate division KSB1 bacterium]